MASLVTSTIGDVVRAHAKATPAAPALLALGAKPLTYAGLAAQLDHVRGVLYECGISAGDRVAVVLPAGAELAACFLSVAATASCIPLNPDQRSQEFEARLRDANAKALITVAAASDQIAAVAARQRIPVIKLSPAGDRVAGKFHLEAPRFSGRGSTNLPQANDIALILHTSGTTSRPKAVPLTHANLTISAAGIVQSLVLTKMDCCLCPMPLFHIHGLVGAELATIYSGGSMICLPGFSGPEFFDALEQLNPTWYTAVPTMHQAIVTRGALIQAGLPRFALRFIRSCSATLRPQVRARLEDLFGVPVVEAYGMTEAAHQIACERPFGGRRKPGSVGVSSGVEMAVMGPEGNLRRIGQSGEIVIRGPSVTQGYLDDPGANAAAFVDGWFRTGDQGRIDEEGDVFLEGRLREIINRSGTKISPFEIEDALTTNPAVAEAVAFAVPEPRLEEEVGAAVVLHDGATLTEQELRQSVAPLLSDYKIPRHIVFLNEIPKGPTGKPQRIGLAQQLGIVLDASAAAAATGTTTLPAKGPPTPTEKLLEALFLRALRVARIGVDENFFDVGGDSLSAVALMRQVGQLSGLQLSIGDLFESPTIRQLAARLTNPTAGLQHLRLVSVQPRGSRPAFYCVGAGPLFRNLALRLGPDQPFFGLLYADSNTLPHPCTLADIAAHHVETLRIVQPHGPYFLGGWCIDGLVAYEVAHQLRAQGEQIGLLVLFDVSLASLGLGQSTIGRIGTQMLETVRRVRFHLTMLRQLPVSASFSYVAQRLQTVWGRISQRAVRLEYSLRLWFRMGPVIRSERAILHRAAANYRPRPLDGPMLLLRRTLRAADNGRGANEWAALALGRFAKHEIPGDHRDMLLEPNVAVTAAKISYCLDSRSPTATEERLGSAPAAHPALVHGGANVPV